MFLQINPQLGIRDFDGAHANKTYLCEIPTGEAFHPCRYLLPTELIEFLKQFDGQTETSAAIEKHLDKHPGGYDPPKLALLVTEYLGPKGFLVKNDREFMPSSRKNHRLSYLYIKVTLLPSHIVSGLTRYLKILFHPVLMACLTPIFILSQILFFTTILPRHDFNITLLDGSDILMLMLLTTVLGLFHELGHASALAYYGWSHSSIGWGLYISFGVFYTDLSDAWRLKRQHRAIVDIGGIYFHLIALFGLFCLLLLTRRPLLVYCFFFVDLQIISSLNPFLRADAFWLFADLFGISNLRQQSIGLAERFIYRVCRIRAKPQYPVLEMSRRTNIIMATYTLCTMAFFIYLSTIIFHQIFYKMVPEYPRQLGNLAMAFSAPWGVSHILHFVDSLIGVLWRTLGLFGVLMFLYRICKGFIRVVRGVVTQVSDQVLINSRASTSG